MVAQKLGIWKILLVFSEIAGARIGATQQLFSKRGLGVPHHTHYSPQYVNNSGIKKFGALDLRLTPTPE